MTHHSAPPRDVGIAYILLLFFGMFGAHRFYAGQQTSAIVQLILTLSLVFAVVTAVWVLVDLFLTAGMIDQYNTSGRHPH